MREEVGYVYESPSVTEFTFVVSDDGAVGVGDYVLTEDPNDPTSYIMGRVEDVRRDVHEGIKGEVMRALMLGSNTVPDLDWTVIARVEVLGVLTENFDIRDARRPAKPMAKVYKMSDEELEKLLSPVDPERAVYLGRVKDATARVFLDPNALVSLHCAVLGMTGSGKSYTVGVLIEEMSRLGIPVIVIDPHGEYSSLRKPAESIPDGWDVEPEGIDDVVTFGPNGPDDGYDYEIIIDTTNLNVEDFKLLIPQMRKYKKADEYVHEAIQSLKDEWKKTGVKYDLADIIEKLEEKKKFVQKATEESAIDAALTSLRKLHRICGNLFGKEDSPDLHRFVKAGRVVVLSLKGLPDEAQQAVVTYFLKRIFEFRQSDEIPPVFTILEEAHNFAPTGEEMTRDKTAISAVRDFAREGRKFLAGLCVVSQRPGRVDSTVLSQCNTMIILKTANPDDLDNIRKSGEGITKEALKRIKSLPVGSAYVTGSAVKIPLFVDVRPRRTAHGGATPDVFEVIRRHEATNVDVDDDFDIGV